MTGIPSPDLISTKIQRIATLANQMPGVALTSLAHHIDIEWLKEAHRRTRKDGAVGIDGQTAAAYAENLEDNLQSLLERAKSGTYLAPPVKRVHIPKGDGTETRPIGIPERHVGTPNARFMRSFDPGNEDIWVMTSLQAWGYRACGVSRDTAHE